MKTKKIVGIVIIVLLVAALGLVAYKALTSGLPEEPEAKCADITGGAWTLKFETNKGKAIADMDICVACAPDSYAAVPTPTRKNYTFKGWYLDAELTQKLEATSTMEITPQPIYSEDGCLVGYSDITLYAKWKKKK